MPWGAKLSPMDIPEWEQIVRLACAVAAGAALGFERELRGRPAGIRTHALVALGSALFALTGIVGFEGFSGDPSRIAAQVVTGLGFIGAGSIIRDGSGVTGLTTAASVWAAGALGMAFAAGAYVPAGATLVLAMVVLTAYRPLQDLAAHLGKTPVLASIEYEVGRGALGEIISGLEELKIRFDSINIDQPTDQPDGPARTVKIRMTLTADELNKVYEFGGKLETTAGIQSVVFT